jgi:hypothetical protein
MIRRIAAGIVLTVAAMAGAMVSPATADDAFLMAPVGPAVERPGGGDPDAFGRAVFAVHDEANQLCMTMWWSNVDGRITSLHIHGPVPGSFIGFITPRGTSTYQCVTVANEALLDDLAANPGGYRISAHSSAYSEGAASGVLGRLR